MQAALKLRGTHGIISIGKRFRSMDDDNDRKLCYDEFKKACQEMKLGLTEADMTRLFRWAAGAVVKRSLPTSSQTRLCGPSACHA